MGQPLPPLMPGMQGHRLGAPPEPVQQVEQYFHERVRSDDNSFIFMLVVFMLMTMALGTTVLVQHQKIRRLEALLTTSVETP